jgi:hypothetical protein
LLPILLAAAIGSTGVPQVVHFQGMLEDEFGVPLQGIYSVTFSIYDQESGGSALWSETRDVDCNDGLFSIVLGENMPVSLDFDTQYWLASRVNGDTEMVPRFALTSVPYAFWSCVADSASRAGFAAQSDSALSSAHAGYAAFADSAQNADHADHATMADSSNGVRWSGISGMPADFADGVDNTGGSGDSHSLDAADGSPANVVYVDNDGNVGVGTSTPAQKLNVSGISQFDLPTGSISLSTPGGWPGVIAYTQNGHRRDIVYDNAGMFIAPSASASAPPATDGITLLESGNVGIGTYTPTSRLHVLGTMSIGTDTAGHDVNFYGANPGSRFFWDEDKMALRGIRDATGGAWHPDSVGQYSLAFGDGCRAINEHGVALGYKAQSRNMYATAIGKECRTLGNHATAVGYRAIAKGPYSTALGAEVETSSGTSIALGYNTIARGDGAAALGYAVQADTMLSIAIGTGPAYFDRMVNSIPHSLMVGFNSTIPTLFVGPSSGIGTTGKVGIGTTSPSEKLDVAGTAEMDGFKMPTGATDGYVLTGNSSGTGTWQPAHVVDMRVESASTIIGVGVTPYDSAQVTLTVPGPGYIAVTSHVWLVISHTQGTADIFYLNHSDIPSSIGDYSTVLYCEVPSSFPTETDYDLQYTVTSTHPVTSAGTYTYHLVGQMLAGADAGDEFYYSQTTGVYYPDPNVTKASLAKLSAPPKRKAGR